MVTNSASTIASNTQVTILQSVFNKQKRAFTRSPIPTAKERIINLDKLRKGLVKYNSALIQAMSEDFGNRPKDASTLNDIMICIESIKYQSKQLKKWMKPTKPHVNIKLQPVMARVYYQPKGVVGIMSPWNFPVSLSISPLITALAAGNSAIIKPSEYTPRTAQVLRTMIEEIFQSDHVAVILGDMAVGIEFTQTPFDHLIFTGSTAVGKHVMKAAAENLTPVTLELGGKSPAIISKDVSMKGTVERLLYGKTTNSGQICVAPDYVLCPKNRIEELVSNCKEVTEKFYPTIKNNPDYTSIINDAQYQRLVGLIADAKEKGGEIIEINPGNDQLDPSARKLPLTLILNPTEDMICMQEEIFGPVLPIMICENIDEALDYIRERPRPLALYYFGYNKAEQRKMVNSSISGGMCLNDTINHFAIDSMPFGGTGSSGMGNYHGFDGFKELSHAKSVLTRPRFNSMSFLYPPYNRFFHRMIRKFLVN